MILQHIKDNKPCGATHYAEAFPHITYLKRSVYGDWLYYNGRSWSRLNPDLVLEIKELIQ